MEQVRIFLTTTGAGTWTVPEDWNNLNNTIEVIGGGGGCSAGNNNGGGGGAYSKKNSQALTPGASISYSVGVGGIGTIYGAASTAGGDTWFGSSVYASSYVAAKGGNRGWGQSNSGTGGQASAGIGDVKYSGGSNDIYQNAGGGAAGPNGNGNNSNYCTGGSGDAGFGGAGGIGGLSSVNGDNGTEWDATHGSGGGGNSTTNGRGGGNGGLYGGGGGASRGNDCYQGSGAQGIIVITYTPVAPGSSNFFQLF